MFSQDFQLKDIVNLEQWQLTQDNLSEVLEVSLVTLSLDGKPLTKVSAPNSICGKLIPQNPLHKEICGQCILNEEARNIGDIDDQTHFQCSFGLDVFVIPITAVGSRRVAYVVIGPVILNRRKESSAYVEEAARLGIDISELMNAIVEISVFTYNKIYSLNKMVERIFSHMAQTGYHKKRLGEMAPELQQMDPLFAHYYEEKILNSLLNACTLALDADSGSVMTLEKDTSMLHVKVAKKLDENAITNSNVKLGEGIAGIAAATAKPLIFPQDQDKKGLEGRLKRSYIKSSMIVPFNRPVDREKSDVYGVLNLNIMRKDRNFSKKDIAFVQELINLVSVALIPVQNISKPVQQ